MEATIINRAAERELRKWFMIILLILLMILAIFFMRVIILPFILGAILAFLLLPIVEKLEKIKIPTNWAIIICYLLIILFFVCFFYFVIPKFIKEMSNLSIYIPQYLESFKETILRFWQNMQNKFALVGITDLAQNGLDKLFKNLADDLAQWLARSISVVPNLFGNVGLIVFAPVLAFYLIKDRTFFARQVNRLFSPTARENILPLCENINLMLRQFIRGYFVIAFLVGTLFSVILLFLDVEYAVTMGLIMAIAELIPYLGLIVAAIPIFMLAFLQGWVVLIKVAVAWLIVQQVENWLIAPKIIGSSVDLHPLSVILAVLLGGYWFGILGLIAAVPVCAMFKIVFIWLYEKVIMWKKSGEDIKNN
jgi:predicted PurR-regulated permease PerM